MRTHVVPFYCVAIGQLFGVAFEKIIQYEVTEKEYQIREYFTPMKRVKKSDFGKPITYGGQTYLFGHDLKTLYEAAAIVKREYDDVLHTQVQLLSFAENKLKAAWRTVTEVVNQELELIGRSAGETSAVHYSVSQDNIDNKNTRPASPAAPLSLTAQEQIGRRMAVFNVYIHSSRPPGAEKECGSAAYCAIIHNIATGELNKLMVGLGAKHLSRVDVLALCAAFESGVLPPSVQECLTIATVYSSNELIVDMFSKGILQKIAESGWKTDGKDVKNKEEWKRVFAHVGHMTVDGRLPEEGDPVMARCVELARAAATEEYTKKFGALSSPGSPEKK
jgi:ribonuclease HI